jgi:tetratricopeptide (TPR) repeat protein
VAIAAYQTLIKAQPKNLALYRGLRKAQAAAGVALTPLPVTLPAIIVTARRLIVAGQYQQAHTQLVAHLKTRPTDGLAKVALAESLLWLDRRQQALAAALDVARTHPKLAGPHRVLGNYYTRMRDRTLAAQQYRLFLKKVAQDPSEALHEARIKALVARMSD